MTSWVCSRFVISSNCHLDHFAL